MAPIFEHPARVEPADIDEFGHVNNLAYVRWMLAAAVAHSAAQGWPNERYRTAGEGWVVRAHHVEYLKPAMPGDDLVVRTWVATMKKATSDRRYEVLHRSDRTVLARGTTEWAYVDLRALSPRRIPAELSRAFEVVTDA